MSQKVAAFEFETEFLRKLNTVTDKTEWEMPPQVCVSRSPKCLPLGWAGLLQQCGVNLFLTQPNQTPVYRW